MKKIVFYQITFLLILVSCNSWVLTESNNENVAVSKTENADATLSTLIEPYKKQLDSSMNEVLGVSAMEMTSGSPEGLLGNFVTDLSLEIGNRFYKKQQNKTADFCLLNNGGLRTFLPEGEITRGKVFEIMPFENELVVVTLTPKKMIELCSYLGVRTVREGTRKQGVPISGNMSVLLRDKMPIEVLVDGQPLRGRNYKVITTDYLANGGDNMSFFQQPVKYEKLGVKLRDAIILYIQEQTKQGNKLSANLDNRIRYDD